MNLQVENVEIYEYFYRETRYEITGSVINGATHNDVTKNVHVFYNEKNEVKSVKGISSKGYVTITRWGTALDDNKPPYEVGDLGLQNDIIQALSLIEN